MVGDITGGSVYSTVSVQCTPFNFQIVFVLRLKNLKEKRRIPSNNLFKTDVSFSVCYQCRCPPELSGESSKHANEVSLIIHSSLE